MAAQWNGKPVVLISADAEWRAVRACSPSAVLEATPFGERFDADLHGQSVRFVQGGWGKISAAASAQWVLDHGRPELLVNLGTCGGLKGG